MEINENNLSQFKRIHILGIGGVSMSAIAETLHSFGHIVTGSDITASSTTDKLINDGINVTIGHGIDDCKKADLVIFSAAIKDTDPEMMCAKENNIPTIIRGEFVGFLTKIYKNTICIAGTHGKTTVTSMISSCFLHAKKDPTIQVGAYYDEIKGNYKIASKDYFILESCEYNGSFLNFHPSSTVILNIDNDHLDYYHNFQNVINAFYKFASLTDSKGIIVTNSDDSNCKLLKDKFDNVLLYSISDDTADYVAKNIKFDEEGFGHFDVYKKNDLLTHIDLSITGNHNISNALACIAICDFYGIDISVIRESLANFKGAGRRQEYKGSFNGVKVFDDYGHHPTEIKATADAINCKKFNKSWVIFQSHTYSRTKEHLKNFAKVLTEFDNIIIAKIYPARETDTLGISGQSIVDEIKASGKDAIYIPEFEDIANYIKEHAEPGDLVLTLGAGNVNQIADLLVEK